jgi:hypothetical protein
MRRLRVAVALGVGAIGFVFGSVIPPAFAGASATHFIGIAEPPGWTCSGEHVVNSGKDNPVIDGYQIVSKDSETCQIAAAYASGTVAGTYSSTQEVSYLGQYPVGVGSTPAPPSNQVVAGEADYSDYFLAAFNEFVLAAAWTNTFVANSDGSVTVFFVEYFTQ